MNANNIWNQLPNHFLVLAPMEGVTDIIFRQVIARAGRPDLFFTEFTNVSSYASEKGRQNALERLEVAPTDPPIIAQIWGKNPAHFKQTCSALKSLGFAGIDLNFGCPDRHVNAAGGGAAMIKTPDLAIECIKNAKQGAKTAPNSSAFETPASTPVKDPLPVSVKTRLGYAYPEEYKTWLPTLLNQNLAALTVHLRTKKEMSKVPAHFELIPEILALRNQIAPETKLIINGDIKNKAHADQLFKKHPEIDGIMIGRGVFENPYCFTDHQPTREELLALLNLHLDLFDNFAATHPRTTKSGEKISPSYEPLKHFFKIYINNFPGASSLRTALMQTHSTPEARQILKNFPQIP